MIEWYNELNTGLKLVLISQITIIVVGVAWCLTCGRLKR